ncbi:myocardin [Clupea harengus]|uniref:Myocardin n=1 Tax=Clupea harengus TaxID=7950 RepID=A0A6P8EML5_CLUHA|nr:myocardin [Clupea harengus]
MNVKTTEKSPEHTFPKPHHATGDTSDPVPHTPTQRSTQRESKNVLQLRLQQRRTREQLADQGIMPPLKSPAAFHEQRKSLERSKTGDYLKHKIRSRPEKSDLVKMRILPDSASREGSPTHRETPTKLKRARLADDLNEKIALRPGPLELVEKNIIPADSTVKEAVMRVNHGKFPKQEDSYAFEEDSSSESLSPDHPLSDESQGSAGPLAETKGNASPSSSSSLTSPPQGSHCSDSVNHGQEENALESNSKQATAPIPVPAIVKPPKTSDKNRHKKPKDIKPKVKKLKYHQYIPPDQKAEKSPPPMDSAYARLLQQQQLFLQLQILSQQKHQQQQQQHSQCPQQQQQQQQQQQHHHQSQSFSYQPLHQQQGNRQSSEQLSTCSSSAASSTVSSSSSPVKTTYCSPTTVNPVKPGPLPPNLDDLKVSELRQQLRIRGLPVSGTKTALIERLRPFRDCSGSPSQAGDITTVTFPVTPTGSLSSYQSPSSSSAMSHGGYYPFCSTSSTPPISPASSELSVSGSLPDSFSDVTMSSPQFGLQASPGQLSADESLVGGLGGGGSNGGCHGTGSGGGGGGDGGPGLDAEKDKMLVEKQKVIEELTWKLHQEQRQVEELRMQLHKRKRTHGFQDQTPPPPPSATPHLPPLHQAQGTPLGPHHGQQPHGLHLHPTNPNQMQHFYANVSVKQEHVASSCPLASKTMKNGAGHPNGGGGGSSSSCMEGMGHCGMMGAPPRCPEAPPSRSPSGLSAFLSPQCSPQDSPGTKTSSSPQPNSLSSSPNHPYMMSPPMGRDGCAHSQGGTRPRNMLIQQKNVSQSLNCPYPSDQRGLQAIYTSPTDLGLNERATSKAKSPHMQPKMAVMHSPRHPGPKCPITSTAFCSSEPAASKIKQPPCYEDAVKQQLTRSQQMDEILDVLIESGEMPANAKDERSCVTKVVPHLTVSAGSASGIAVPKFHRHYGHMSPSQMSFEHAVSHGDCHLEALLSSPVSRQGDIVLLKIVLGAYAMEDILGCGP